MLTMYLSPSPTHTSIYVAIWKQCVWEQYRLLQHLDDPLPFKILCTNYNTVCLFLRNIILVYMIVNGKGSSKCLLCIHEHIHVSFLF